MARRILLVLCLAAAGAVPPGAADDPSPAAGTPARSDVRTVSGTVTSISPEEHLLFIDTDAGPVKLELDRNTSVFLPAHLGTVRDLAPGASVRASFGAERRAYWIEVRGPPPGERADSAGGAPARTDVGPPQLPKPSG